MTFDDDTDRALHDAFLALDAAASGVEDAGHERLLDLAARMVDDVREEYRELE